MAPVVRLNVSCGSSDERPFEIELSGGADLPVRYTSALSEGDRAKLTLAQEHEQRQPRLVGSAGEAAASCRSAAEALVLLLPLAVQLYAYCTTQGSLRLDEGGGFSGLLPALYVIGATGSCASLGWAVWWVGAELATAIRGDARGREAESRHAATRRVLATCWSKTAGSGWHTTLACCALLVAISCFITCTTSVDFLPLTMLAVLLVLGAAVVANLLVAHWLLARIDREYANQPALTKRERQMRWRRLMLSTVPLLSALHPSDLAKMAHALELDVHMPPAAIVTAGDLGAEHAFLEPFYTQTNRFTMQDRLGTKIRKR